MRNNRQPRPEKRYIRANGIELSCEFHGTGDPIVLLHGSMGTGAVWGAYPALLADQFQLIVPDLRGHGLTFNTGARIDIAVRATDIAALIEQMDIKQATLCGWSMGGDIALQVASQRPDLVARLVIGGVTIRVPEGYVATLQAMGLDAPGRVNVARAEQMIPDLVASWRQVHSQSEDHWIDLLRNLSHMMMAPQPPAHSLLGAIGCPTLIVWGDRDQFMPVEVAVELYRILQRPELAIVPNADHFVSRTHPALFASLLKGFLTRNAL